ncbi:carbohydrate kinase family protein [Patescibacteria group bacterium]|nr:carbohydrate kinase family protein [Patescibacteria group bacterium]
MKNILVTGSLAYDYIMNFKERFADHILPDKIHILNVSFGVDNLSKQLGGTAGNIAYNLALLGEQPTIAATAGKDFTEYAEWLQKNKITTDCIKILPEEYTASAHIITDIDDNQITSFHAGAMLGHNISLKEIIEKIKPELAILAPDCKEGMIKHAQEFREAGVPYIFDPGQGMPLFNKEELIGMITGSKVAIFNDYELQLFRDRTGLSQEKVEDFTEYLIVTLGGKGSIIYHNGKEYQIPTARPKNTSDPTGAGDAYRAGIIKGLLCKLPIEKIGKVAALASVYTVELYGTQTHKYTLAEFRKRYKDNFAQDLKL